MSDPRKPVFDAFRTLMGGSLTEVQVWTMNDTLNRLGAPSEAQAVRRAINRVGLQIIKDSEGLSLKAYLCPANVLTIGYGSTGAHVKPGMVITEAHADELLRSDLRRFEDCVAEAAPNSNANQFSAMVSLAFNIGEGAFLKSTVLREHLAGHHVAAADAFGMWTKGGGKTLPGLVKRRQKEAQLYRTVA